jgi:DNA helicase-2/ATP-dependent DNA helicase PcrA
MDKPYSHNQVGELLMAKYSALDIARAINTERDPKPDPTPEQIAVIESPFDESSLVIAGAGSGKTTTMADRVVYLVVNDLVRVDQILGMTFTRKAAGELAKKVREMLERAIKSPLLDLPHVAPEDIYGASITTYNAFANRIFTDYAHLLGRNPDSSVISEATAWQLARDVVAASASVEISDLDKRLDDVTEALLRAARGLKDNLRTSDDLRAFGEQFLKAVPEGMPIALGKTRKYTDQTVFKDSRAAAIRLLVLADLVDDYEQVKRDRKLIEFSDQMELASRLVEKPVVFENIRSQFKVVLLDEYQDTSSVQIAFLSRLFTGVPVMAVGDPKQAIYGWRGASASSMNITNFFAGYAPGQKRREVYPLSYSWRNPEVVLRGANRVAAPLSAKPLVSPGDPLVFDTQPLKAGVSSRPGSCAVEYFTTIDDEAAAVAQWFKDKIDGWPDAPEGAGLDADGKPRRPSAALLSRRIADLEIFKRALDDLDVPYRVVGLGGLLVDPLIVDLVCTLRVIHFAGADSELIRLLAGARWQIAPRDLRGLKKAAKWLAEHDEKHQKISDELRKKLRDSIVSEDSESLVDALDFIADRANKNHGALEHISDEGFIRLREAGKQMAKLRRFVGFDLHELVTIVLQETNLDIEAEANETMPSSEPVLAGFMEAIDSYSASAAGATLGGFLGWLEQAEARDKMSPASESVSEPGVVHLMTIHGAKGLEWDLVAIPRQFQPDKGTITGKAETWMTFGVIPDDLRQDRADLLPHFQWRNQESQVTLGDSFDAYKDGARDRYLAEDRRLAYVAITRAAHHVYLTGALWDTRANPAGPNEYLYEIESVVDQSNALPLELPKKEEKPENVGEQRAMWPLPALAKRENLVETAAALVNQALASLSQGSDASDADELVTKDIDLLIAERDRAKVVQPMPLPKRIPASKFKDFVEQPDKEAERLRRPVPSAPYRATMLGTIFHSWVEQRGKAAEPIHGIDYLDVDPNEVDGLEDLSAIDEAKLASLKQTFENSEWGSLDTHAVELEIQLPLGPNIVICKIDAIYMHITQENGVEKVRYDIVDWKTGKAPSGAKDLELRQLQLALYRLAFAQYTQIPLEDVDVAFYFVADDLVIRPDRVFDEAELLERWSSIY